MCGVSANRAIYARVTAAGKMNHAQTATVAPLNWNVSQMLVVFGAKVVMVTNEFDLKLESFDALPAKIKLIKEVRWCTDLSLREAKDLVENIPSVFKRGVSREEGEKIIEKMKALGAKVVMEKYKFALKLESFDAPAKIKLIKEVIRYTGLGFKEARDLVDNVPSVFKKRVSKEEGENIIGKMKALGAKVVIE
ncbi:Ribosomal protein L7/L12 [Heracleum sosnowskyi]|uniref:Large ribosomal subunit protein bL12c n=1 Tax=Heracleum sosnowskyi TaxID=360622 RepID=A0AAD8MBP9_9APIA|nr:Ribosomal protein L7/L12 [Heracleum sosnowskyi]